MNKSLLILTASFLALTFSPSGAHAKVKNKIAVAKTTVRKIPIAKMAKKQMSEKDRKALARRQVQHARKLAEARKASEAKKNVAFAVIPKERGQSRSLSSTTPKQHQQAFDEFVKEQHPETTMPAEISEPEDLDNESFDD
jgi:hypothetical protein